MRSHRKRPARQRLSTDLRRAQIIDAALGIIARDGVAGLTVDAVARDAGISSGNIYRHFSGKAAVMAAVFDRVAENLKRILEDSRSSPDVLSRLRGILCAHAAFLEENPGIPRMVFSDDTYSAQSVHRDRLHRTVGFYAQELLLIFRVGVHNGVLRGDLDVPLAVSAFMGMIQSTALQWVLSGYSFSPVKRVKSLWDMYVRGIRA